MSQFTAILDANVLYPNYLRDILIECAHRELYRAKWTEKITEEWVENLLKNRPDIPRIKIDRLCQLMEKAVPDSLIQNYESIIPSLTLPDPNDRHILAAAIIGHADMIVTNNIKDFPQTELGKYNIESIVPDKFLVHQFHLNPHKFMAAIVECSDRIMGQDGQIKEYLLSLINNGLIETVDLVTDFIIGIKLNPLHSQPNSGSLHDHKNVIPFQPKKRSEKKITDKNNPRLIESLRYSTSATILSQSQFTVRPQTIEFEQVIIGFAVN